MSTHNDLPHVRFRLNMGRIRGLIKVAFADVDLRQPKSFLTDGPRADLRRTIVVFLHATFEDVLRTIARERIATVRSQDVLDKIPLIGTSAAGRVEKFYLGALNVHRRKTVDQLIHESVQGYLDRTSFGSIHDVEEILLQMGLDTTPFKYLYPDLAAMMQRRHRIVHNADLPNRECTTSGPWTFGDDLDLGIWMLAVVAFCGQLRLSVDPTDEVQRWFLASQSSAITFARDVRVEILALLTQPPSDEESLRLGLGKASERLDEVAARLAGPSSDEVFQIWKKSQSPKDDSTDEEVLARIIAWRDSPPGVAPE